MTFTFKLEGYLGYKFFTFGTVYFQPKRNFTPCYVSQIYSEELLSRGLVQIKGSDSAVFLQGLITNDVEHLLNGALSMYTMFLNTKGRVKYDAIIYKIPKEINFLIEVDKKIVPNLIKHLNLYKLKKKVEISNLESLKIASVFDFKEVLKCLPQPLLDVVSRDYKNDYFQLPLSLNLNLVNDSVSGLDDIETNPSIFKCRDPRIQALGMRLLCPKETDLNRELSGQGVTFPSKSESLYKLCRYLLGVAEGFDEMPDEKSFPLELNADYLHGVSFHKGCYIGQELTARTYHTGVIRKRLMPIALDGPCDSNENIMVTASDALKTVGKLRGVVGPFGLGVLRTVEGLSAPNLMIGSISAHCFKPTWWPQQNQK